jgi:pimeloyl-ACP methyl ester carboxylesterase
VSATDLPQLAMSRPREGLVDLGDRQLATLEWGPVDGPIVLALHGYPDTAWTWRRVAPILARAGHRVIAPFTRGYAPSSLAPDGCYQVGALARDVEELAAAIGVGPSSALLGHDWGAITAYVVGSHRPELFGRIVTIAVPPLRAAQATLNPWPPSGIATFLGQLHRSWYVGFQQLPWAPERNFDRVVARLWADWSPGYDASEDLDLLAKSLPAGPHRSAALGYYRALAQPWRRSGAYRDEQRHLRGTPRAPVLYLHGADDGCLLPALAASARDVLAPGSEVEIVTDAGHFLQLEQPERTAELVLSFLDRQET